MSLETVLGSRNRVRVLRALFRRDGVSGRQAARMCGLSPSAAGVALSELVEAGFLLQSGTIGKHYYEINRNHCLFAATERLFADEGRFPRLVAETVLRHLRGTHPPRDILGIGIGNDRMVTVVAAPSAAGDALPASLKTSLRSEFGLHLGDLRRKPLPEDYAGTWIGVEGGRGERPAPSSHHASRDMTLHFFGLGLARRQGN